MKPSFALDFRDGTIVLLHRTSRGWQQVGATPLDAADLNEALNYLRSTALGLSPRGLATKLVIPNDQVLYTQVHAPGPEVAKRKKQIKAALEGLTPYKVDDLVYDWWGSGPEVQVAVVAKETLAEAEAFAAEHRFNPVSFVAAPENGAYMGEPFFGPSALAATLLAEGEKVERDQDPISVIAREYPRSEPVPVVETIAAAPAEPVKAEVVLAEPEASKPAADVAPPVVSETLPAPTQAAAPEPAMPKVATPVADVAAERDPLPDFRAAKAPSGGALAFDPKKMAVDLVDEAPMAVDVGDERTDLPAAPEPVRKAVPEEAVRPAVERPVAERPPVERPHLVAPVAGDLPPSPAAAVFAAFASRRAAAEPAVELSDTEAVAAAKAKKAPSVGSAPSQRPSVPRPSLARPASAGPAALRETLPFPSKTQPAKFSPGKPVKTSFNPAARDRNVVPLPKAAVPVDAAPSQAAAKLAPKGTTGLDGRPLPTKGKPRYLGLILTAILLLALAAVAAWSSFYLTSSNSDPNATPTKAGVASLTPTATSATPSVAADSAGAKAVPSDAGTVASATAPQVAPVANAGAASASSQVHGAAVPTAGTDVASAASTASTVDTAANAAAPAAVAAATQQSEAKVSAPDASAATTADAAANAGAAAPAAVTATAPQADAKATTPDTTAAATPTVASAATPAAAVPQAAAPETVASAAPVVSHAPSAEAVATSTASAPEVVAAKPEPAPKTALVTDAAVAAVPGNEPQDEIFLAAADVAPQAPGPIMLPQLAAAVDPPPEVAAPPPPYGTVYKFDADGRIMPTPEGIITPEGVLLIAGAPKVIPPDRPAALTAAAPVVPAAPTVLLAPVVEAPSTAGIAPANDSVAPLAAPVAIVNDPALAGKKPKARPANLPAATATAKQGEVQAPDAGSQFTSLRPSKRPDALTKTASADTADVGAGDASAASLAANGVKASTSAQAVAVSKVPAARPNGLDQAVNAAVAAAVKSSSTDQVAANDVSVAPDAQAEPEVEAPAPNLPTNASVAKQATSKHALNMSQVALLGIFGTASTRYAEVRLPGGGVKKVVVGDTIDGGRIAAITETAVQYQKGGQMLTLSLPTG